ncbi:S-layer homology domain-containing protein [uncultured Oscillibacter sp.]|uniref:S-layer homology domain-containing protein n=1 Tax=uncultured Oscillibacter sp. TaxID=876091 RepID=UPI00280BFDA6|nr:S-layer homology domain-containing protein [uncultured Oscillibacter sp.]
MKKGIILCFTLLLLLSVLPWAGAAEAAPGDSPIDPFVCQQMLGKGMDVDWCKTAAGKSLYNSAVPKDFKETGISHVRIRVKDAATEELLALLDRQVQDCLAAGLIPIIAYQADALKNEPDRLNEIYERLVSAVRQTNPERIIMISPRMRSDAAYLQDLEIPSASNGYLMAEWHFYASGPSKENPRKLWTAGTAEEKALVQEKIDLALQWQADTGVPIWVGAWMPGNYNDGDDYTISEQAVFASFVAQALTDAGIPFAVNADSHFYDREQNTWLDHMQPVFSAIYGTQTLPFTDAATDAWYRSAVSYVYEHQLFSGTSATAFSPERFMTRQQMWMVMARLEGVQPQSMADAQTWAVSAGLSDGSAPAAEVTRQQLVTYLWWLAGSPDTSFALDPYTDAARIAPYAAEAMAWAVEQGLMNGTSAQTLSPGNVVTRAQTAVILARYSEWTGI